MSSPATLVLTSSCHTRPESCARWLALICAAWKRAPESLHCSDSEWGQSQPEASGWPPAAEWRSLTLWSAAAGPPPAQQTAAAAAACAGAARVTARQWPGAAAAASGESEWRSPSHSPPATTQLGQSLCGPRPLQSQWAWACDGLGRRRRRPAADPGRSNHGTVTVNVSSRGHRVPGPGSSE